MNAPIAAVSRELDDSPAARRTDAINLLVRFREEAKQIADRVNDAIEQSGVDPCHSDHHARDLLELLDVKLLNLIATDQADEFGEGDRTIDLATCYLAPAAVQVGSRMFAAIAIDNDPWYRGKRVPNGAYNSWLHVIEPGRWSRLD